MRAVLILTSLSVLAGACGGDGSSGLTSPPPGPEPARGVSAQRTEGEVGLFTLEPEVPVLAATPGPAVTATPTAPRLPITDGAIGAIQLADTLYPVRRGCVVTGEGQVFYELAFDDQDGPGTAEVLIALDDSVQVTVLRGDGTRLEGTAAPAVLGRQLLTTGDDPPAEVGGEATLTGPGGEVPLRMTVDTTQIPLVACPL